MKKGTIAFGVVLIGALVAGFYFYLGAVNSPVEGKSLGLSLKSGMTKEEVEGVLQTRFESDKTSDSFKRAFSEWKLDAETLSIEDIQVTPEIRTKLETTYVIKQMFDEVAGIELNFLEDKLYEVEVGFRCDGCNVERFNALHARAEKAFKSSYEVTRTESETQKDAYGLWNKSENVLASMWVNPEVKILNTTVRDRAIFNPLREKNKAADESAFK
jgi:hypothetical protein